MWNPQLLFQKHAGEINRFLRKCGHGQDEAADLTQDVFTRLLGAPRLGRDDNSRAYLYAVARNLSTDVYRRQQLARFADITEDHYHGIPDPSPSPERIVSDRQQLQAMDRALAELPPKTRRAFELYRFGDLTITQVAGELGLSISRTWTLVQRACLHVRASVRDNRH